MYQNTAALPRLDLVGALRSEDMSLDAYIAHRILPIFPVAKPAANIPRILITDDQVLTLKRGPKTAFQRFEGSVDTVGFSCQSSGIEEPMSAEDYSILGQDGAEANATLRSAHAVLRARDAALVAATMSAAGETLFSGQVTTATGSVAWDQATGVPITDIAAASLALALRIGDCPLTLVIGRQVLADLRINAQVLARFRQISGINDPKAVMARLTVDQLAPVLGVDEILVGSGRKNTAIKGQTAVKAWVFPDNYALLLPKISNPSDLTETCLGRTFSWDQADAEIVPGAAVMNNDPLHGLMVESYRDEPIKADVIRTEEYTDQKILNVKAAQLIKSI